MNLICYTSLGNAFFATTRRMTSLSIPFPSLSISFPSLSLSLSPLSLYPFPLSIPFLSLSLSLLSRSLSLSPLYLRKMGSMYSLFPYHLSTFSDCFTLPLFLYNSICWSFFYKHYLFSLLIRILWTFSSLLKHRFCKTYFNAV